MFKQKKTQTKSCNLYDLWNSNKFIIYFITHFSTIISGVDKPSIDVIN